MSSPFDQDEPIKVIKAKKPVTEAALSNVLKASAATTKAAEDSAVAQPDAIAKIRHAISKIITTNKIGKRSMVTSKIVEKLFTDMEDDEETAVYGAIDVTIATMIAEGDLQEFRFVDSSETVIESMLVTPALALDIDDGMLPGIGDMDELVGDSAETAFDIPDEDVEAAIENAEAEEQLDHMFDGEEHQDALASLNDRRAALNENVQMFAVYSQANGKTNCQLMHDAAGALAEFSNLRRFDGVYAQVYGLIPIDIKVELDFHTQPTAPIEEGEMAVAQSLAPQAPEAAADVVVEPPQPAA